MGKRTYSFTSGSSHSTLGIRRTEIRREGQSLSACNPQLPSGPVHRPVIITSELSLLSSASKSSVRNDSHIPENLNLRSLMKLSISLNTLYLWAMTQILIFCVQAWLYIHTVLLSMGKWFCGSHKTISLNKVNTHFSHSRTSEG